MSRPDKAVEPSMEEILASIRKIISEEPLGNRPSPSDRQAPTDALGRHEPGANPALTGSPLSPGPRKESDAVGIDDVLNLAQGTASAPKPTAAEPRVSRPVSNEAATGNGATPTHIGMPESTKPVPAASQRDHNSSGGASEIAGVAPRQPDDGAKAPKPSVDADVALSEARAKIERHLSTPKTDHIDRVPLPGLKSIRDAEFRGVKQRSEPDTAGKQGSGGLMARVAAASARPENSTAEPAKAGTSVASNGALNSSADTKGPAQRAADNPGTVKAEMDKVRVPDAANPANAANGQGAASAVGQAAGASTTAPADGRSRAFEDAVAEMLRPMLRQWLEANLPRLVQQALREEMAKSSLPGKDNTDA